MKYRLLILNWLFALLLLTYNGDSLILTFVVFAYFALCTFTLIRNQRGVEAEIRRAERKMILKIRKRM